MADRRADETPVAPRRSLSAPGHAPDANGEARAPIGRRAAAALSATGSALQSAASPSSRTSGTSERSSADRSAPTGRSSSTSTRSSSPSRTGAGSPAARPRGTRRARLRLVHVDPWSIMKTAFLLSIAFGIVTVVAVAVVWSVLGAAGVWDSINKAVSDVIGSQSSTTFDVKNYVGTSRVLGFTMIVAVVDVVLITAIATLGAFLYNLAAALLGGLEVTFAEDER